MTRYFISILTRDGHHIDEEGRNFRSLEEASRYGIQAARAVIAQDALMGFIDLFQTVRIDTADGLPLKTIPFRDAIAFHDSWAGFTSSEYQGVAPGDGVSA